MTDTISVGWRGRGPAKRVPEATIPEGIGRTLLLAGWLAGCGTDKGGSWMAAHASAQSIAPPHMIALARARFHVPPRRAAGGGARQPARHAPAFNCSRAHALSRHALPWVRPSHLELLPSRPRQRPASLAICGRVPTPARSRDDRRHDEKGAQFGRGAASRARTRTFPSARSGTCTLGWYGKLVQSGIWRWTARGGEMYAEAFFLQSARPDALVALGEDTAHADPRPRRTPTCNHATARGAVSLTMHAVPPSPRRTEHSEGR